MCVGASAGGVDEDTLLPITDTGFHKYNTTFNMSQLDWYNFVEVAGQSYHINFSATGIKDNSGTNSMQNITIGGFASTFTFNISGRIIVMNSTPPQAQVADTTKPVVNATVNMSLFDKIIRNDVINITANATDETGLSFCQIMENSTGAFKMYNFSLTGTAGACSQKFNFSSGYKSVVNVTAIVNDTANNLQQNTTIIIGGRNKTYIGIDEFNRANSGTLGFSTDPEDHTNSLAWGVVEKATTDYSISGNKLSFASALLGQGSYIEVNASTLAFSTLNGTEVFFNNTASSLSALEYTIIKIFSKSNGNPLQCYSVNVIDSALSGVSLKDNGGIFISGMSSPFNLSIIAQGEGASTTNKNFMVSLFNGTNF